MIELAPAFREARWRQAGWLGARLDRRADRDDEVFKFVETFKAFPPRSFPQSFVPATIMEEQINQLKDVRKAAPMPK